MVIAIYAKKMQYIYNNYTYTYRENHTPTIFWSWWEKKRNVQLLLVLFVYPTKWSKRKNVAVLLVAKPHFFDKSKPKWPKKTWSGPFDKNRQRDCGYIYTIIIDIYVYQIISNILYTSIAWVFLFKPTFHLYIMSYHRRRPTSAQGLTMSGCRASHLKPSAHRGRIIKISSGFPSK